MGEQLNFRALLLKLQDALSRSDRERFHFILGDIIPADVRDDLSMGSTLKLLETLIKQGNIDQQDVGFLIKVFSKIHCQSIVNMLKQHERFQQLEDEEDSIVTTKCSSNQMIESENINSTYVSKEITPNLYYHSESTPLLSNGLHPIVTSQSLVESTLVELNESNQNKESCSNRCYQILKKKTSKWSVLLFIFNIIFLSFAIVLFPLRWQLPIAHVRCLDDVYAIKEGDINGGNGGESFDDAKGYGLTYGDRCTAVEVHWSSNLINSVRFTYRMSSTQDKTVHYGSHGEDAGFHEEFQLLPDEEINKVTVNARNITMVTNTSYFLITGIRFHTTQGRMSQHYGASNDPSLTESYDGYTLFYVKGRSGRFLDGLRFVWSKTCARVSSKECMPSS
ncbi:unnamed protein product [Adineta ricciae]|nr:unnamed protein product [Adineta ricciae]